MSNEIETITIREAKEILADAGHSPTTGMLKKLGEQYGFLCDFKGERGSILLDKKRFMEWKTDLKLTPPKGYMTIGELGRSCNFSAPYINKLCTEMFVEYVEVGINVPIRYYKASDFKNKLKQRG